MRGLILAAGRGSRLGALTDERPKGLVPLAGRPLLEHQLEAFAQAGIEAVALVCGYRAEAFPPGLRRFHNARWSTSGIVASLACAEPWLEEDTLVLYADVLVEPRALRALAATPDDVALSYDRGWLARWRRRFADPLDDAERFRVDADGRVLAIGGRARSVDEIEGQYMGLVKLTPAGAARTLDAWRALAPALRRRIDVTALLARRIAAGEAVRGVPYEGFWCELDHPRDLELAEQELAERRA